MHPGIKELIHSFPEKPGVYRHYDTKGRLLYVGKAKNLKRRVSSYFTKTHDSFRLRLLVKQITDIQFTVVKDEKEALLLEKNLIRNEKNPNIIFSLEMTKVIRQ
ncbi:GIY-YIG nuclease family protein [Chitinophagales bacterium]|nr:GIY-YIG nuclease family protein [Chitinophagales bacterium]